MGLLKQVEAGRPMAGLCRQIGVTDTTFHKRRRACGSLGGVRGRIIVNVG